MNKNKEAIMLAKGIIIAAALISTIIYPPIILVAIVGWAGWTLWKNYTV